jgi:hypothetical protein
MAIDRTAFNALVDDNGTNTTGTPWTKAEIAGVILDPVDAAIAAVVPAPGGTGPGKFLKEQVANNSLALEFLGVLSSAFQQYAIELINVAPNTLDDCCVQYSTDNGVTWDTDGVYRSVLNYAFANSSALLYEQSYNGIMAAFAARINDGLSGVVHLFDPQNATTSKRHTFLGGWHGDGPGGGGFAWGSWENPAPATAVRIRFRTATIVSGIARIYGIGPG